MTFASPVTSVAGRLLGAALATVLVASPQSLLACATCFGRSDSPMAQGMNMGIFTLLFVILSVLVGIAAFFFYIIRRAARLEAQTGSMASSPRASSVELGH